MPVLSHVHHLFNAEQCQVYIHTLRWKDRPLQCPRCQSHHIGRWGTYQEGAFGHSDAFRSRCWYRINTWSSVPLYFAHRSANI
jgi:hypothetical protein